MNDDNPRHHSDNRPPGRQGLRLLAMLTVLVGVLALAAAAFVFSYAPVYDIAHDAGVRPGLARFYPALPDAVLVVACAAALALRGARWWARWLVWLSIIALVALMGAADVVHAIAFKLPRRPVAAAVAVLPWALLLLGFRLWLSVLRHMRSDQRPAAGPATAGPVASVAQGGTAGAAGLDETAIQPAPSGPVPSAAAPSGPAVRPVTAVPGAGDQAVAAPGAAADTAIVAATANSTSGKPAAASASPAANDPQEHADGAAGSTGSPIALHGLDLILPPYPDEPPPAEPSPAGECARTGEAPQPVAPAPPLGAPVPDEIPGERVPSATPGSGASPRQPAQSPPGEPDAVNDFRRVRSSPLPPEEPELEAE
jgi:hypothetical protein